MDKILTSLRDEFQKNLSRKTGWGRNEVMSEFDSAVIRVLMAVASEKGLQRATEDSGKKDA